jgi:hypothetical protein
MSSYKIRTVTVKAFQSLFDIAIQEYGTAEGIFTVMMANLDKITSITQDLTPGDTLKIWPVQVLEDVVKNEESLTPYLSILMQWIIMIGGLGGEPGSGGLNDGDYVHIRGNEVVDGIKSFLDPVKTNEIYGFGEDDGVNVEGILINDGVIDLGSF